MVATAYRGRRRWHRIVDALSAFINLTALVVCAMAFAWWYARPVTPGAFYRPPPGAAREAGALLRSEPFARAVPAGARAWRILYATTRADGSPAVASAIVMTSSAPSDAPRNIIAWAHGTTGIVPGCAPSLLRDPFMHVPALPELVSAGWAYVATDYVGLGTAGGHAYLVGEDAARAMLDAVRAARGMEGVSLSRRTAVWGHAQGGHAALWTAMRAADYAPDVELVGVAALAPASDLPRLLQAVQGTVVGKIVTAYVTSAYAEVFPETNARSYLRPGARSVVADIAGRCIGRWDGVVSAFETILLPPDGIFQLSPATGGFGARLAANVPRGAFVAPVLIAQGGADELVPPAIQDVYVAGRCADGQAVDYRTYPARDHLSLLARASPLPTELIAWTQDRFAGLPAASTCPPR